MAKLRITVEVDIPDENDIPAVAQMTSHLVQATTKTVHKLCTNVQNPFAIGECQGQGEIVGDGLKHIPTPEMPMFERVRRERIER